MDHGNVNLSNRSACVAIGTALTLALLITASCASKPSGPEANVDRRLDEYTKLIDEEIKDPERAEKMKALIERLNAEFDRQAEEIRARQRELKEAARSYQSSDAELETILAELRREALDLSKVLQDGHFELRDLVTEEEWKEIVNHRRKILGIF